MRVVLSDDHRSHFPAGELYDGALVRPFECPERWDHVVAALDATGLDDRTAPDGVDLDRVRRVHDPAYVEFLEEFWDDWVAAGHAGEAIPMNFPVRNLRDDRVPVDPEGRLGFYAFAAETAITAGTWHAAQAAAGISQTAQRLVARCDVQPATVITPMTPAAANEWSSPRARSTPAPTSVEAAR